MIENQNAVPIYYVMYRFILFYLINTYLMRGLKRNIILFSLMCCYANFIQSILPSLRVICLVLLLLTHNFD